MHRPASTQGDRTDQKIEAFLPRQPADGNQFDAPLALRLGYRGGARGESLHMLNIDRVTNHYDLRRGIPEAIDQVVPHVSGLTHQEINPRVEALVGKRPPGRPTISRDLLTDDAAFPGNEPQPSGKQWSNHRERQVEMAQRGKNDVRTPPP